MNTFALTHTHPCPSSTLAHTLSLPAESVKHQQYTGLKVMMVLVSGVSQSHWLILFPQAKGEHAQVKQETFWFGFLVDRTYFLEHAPLSVLQAWCRFQSSSHFPFDQLTFMQTWPGKNSIHFWAKIADCSCCCSEVEGGTFNSQKSAPRLLDLSPE